MPRSVAVLGSAVLLNILAAISLFPGKTASITGPRRVLPKFEAVTSSRETTGQAGNETGAAGVGVDSNSESKQVLFSVGGRPQRVRFMIAAHGQTFNQMQLFLGPDAASIRKLIDDPIQSLPNAPQGKYIRQAKPPAAPGVGLDSFAEGDNFYAGEVINPGLVLCSANLLNLVKAAGDERPGLFQSQAINEINLFVRAVPEPTGDATLRVGIGPAAVNQPGSALNVLVEYLPLQLQCSLPTLQQLEQQLDESTSQ
jgi:hypothetical protein